MSTKFQTLNVFKAVAIMLLGLQLFSCKKEQVPSEEAPLLSENISAANVSQGSGESQYNMEVVLRGEGNRNGHIHFGQDRDAAKVIALNIKIRHLQPNHQYRLQRAVDPMNVVDGNCTSNSWLTLGYGLVAHAIQTDEKGNGEDILWRDVTAIPSGARFDIHFRVIDDANGTVVLTSDCYQYRVR